MNLFKQYIVKVLPLVCLLTACSQEEMPVNGDNGNSINGEMPIRIEARMSDFVENLPATKIEIDAATGIKDFSEGDEIGLWLAAPNDVGELETIGGMRSLTYRNGNWEGNLPTWNDLLPYMVHGYLYVNACYPKPEDAGDEIAYTVEVPADQRGLTDEEFDKVTCQFTCIGYVETVPSNGILSLSFRYAMDRLWIVLKGEGDIASQTTVALPDRYAGSSFYMNQCYTYKPATIYPRFMGEQNGEYRYCTLIPQCGNYDYFDTFNVFLSNGGVESTHEITIPYIIGQGGVDYTVILNLKAGE